MSTNFPATESSDVYKVFHAHAGHPDIVSTYENFTNRSSRLSNVENGTHVVNVGWQYVIKKHYIDRWNNTFFKVDKEQAISRYKMVTKSILGFEVSTKHLEDLHDLGYLPLKVKTYPEGTLVPYGVASATFETTVNGFEWLVGMLETVTSQEVWPIQTSATTVLAYYQKQKEFFEETGAPMELLPFMCHDFSARGCFGEEASAMSGFGHLCVGFVGSDTIAAGNFAEKWYGADWGKDFIMASVNATEHSVTCGWLEEGEYEYFKHLMTEVAPTGILSVVSDTWDFWHTITVIAPDLKEIIMSREGKLVFRPDSGDPVKILTGYKTSGVEYSCVEDVYEASPYEELGTEAVNIQDEFYECSWINEDDFEIDLDNIIEPWEINGLVQELWNTFGGTTTDKGFKMLDEHVGTIYGDSITLERQDQIGKRLMEKGFVPQAVLGVGSYSYQYVTRDTHGSAMKATNVTKFTDDEGYFDQAIFKDPKTDKKKKSAKGLLRVEKEEGILVQYDMQTREQESMGLLETVFEDGVLLKEQSLNSIREVVSSQI